MIPLRPKIEVNEYQQLRHKSAAPSHEDEQLAERLMSDSAHPRLQVRWLSNGEIDVTAHAWVGVVSFSQVDIHVLPKSVGGNLGLLKMLDFTRGTQSARHLENHRQLKPDGSHLLDIVVRLFLEANNTLIRHGLLHRYRSQHDLLPVLRGRLDHRAQVLKRFGQLDKLHCSFDEHDTDHADHQLLVAALDVVRSMVSDEQLRHDLDRQRSHLSAICTPHTHRAAWYRQQIVYNRINERYRAAHDLAYLLLDHSGFDDLFNTNGSLRVSSFMIDMNSLFEKFVSKVFSEAAISSEFHVSAQERFRASIIRTSTASTYSTLKPDLVIRHVASGATIPLDIKYKQYVSSTISTADLYQAFTYALAISQHQSLPAAGLVFPGNSTAVTEQLEILSASGLRRGRITAVSLDINSILDDITQNRLAPSARLSLQQVLAQFFPNPFSPSIECLDRHSHAVMG